MHEGVPSSDEIERQYRTMRLMLDAHSCLKDRYTFLALAFQISLLVCSVVFCATTFASDDFYAWLHTTPTSGRYLRGSASVIAFATSVVLLVFDFRSVAGLHGAAVDRWSKTLAEFRRHQPIDSAPWPDDCRRALFDSYWTADKECVKIKGKQFLAMKALHLRKVAVSKLKSRHPGCPIVLLSVLFRMRDTSAALREFFRGARPHDGTATNSNAD